MSADHANLIERAKVFLNQCGACDAGLPLSCTCPPVDPRPVIAELIEALERLITQRS